MDFVNSKFFKTFYLDNLIQDSTILEEFKKKLDLNKKTSLFVRNSQVNWNQIILKKNELKVCLFFIKKNLSYKTL